MVLIQFAYLNWNHGRVYSKDCNFDVEFEASMARTIETERDVDRHGKARGRLSKHTYLKSDRGRDRFFCCSQLTLDE